MGSKGGSGARRLRDKKEAGVGDLGGVGGRGGLLAYIEGTIAALLLWGKGDSPRTPRQNQKEKNSREEVHIGAAIGGG